MNNKLSTNSKIGAIVLAAGQGKRMKSELPKVLHKVAGLPMIKHVVDILEGAGIFNIVVVVGHGAMQVRSVLKNHHPHPLKYVHQEKRLGTAHAVMCAEPLLFGKVDKVIVIYGDTPLFTSDTIKELIRLFNDRKPVLVLVSFDAKNPTGYGRVISNKLGHVSKVVEEKDATESEKKIKEVNAGLYCFEADFLWQNLPKIKISKITGEYYLPDLIGIAVEKGRKIIRYKISDETEALGVNTPIELKEARKIMLERKNNT